MITSVYLSNDTIYVVQGDRSKGIPKKARTQTFKMPEGNLLNGLITNEEELTEQLSQIWKENKFPSKGVELVLATSLFSGKTLTLPKMPEKKIYPVLPMEFQDMELPEDAYYDYMLVQQEKKTGQQEIFAVAIESEVIEKWISIFEGIGVHLDTITIARGTMMKYLSKCAQLQGKASVVQILDERSLVNILWVNDKMVYTTVKRLFTEGGTPEFAVEVVRNIDSIQQVYATLKQEAPLKDIYMSGFEAADIEACQETLTDAGIDMKTARIEEEHADVIFAVGNLIQGDKSVDILKLRKKNKAHDPKKANMLKPFYPAIILAGLGVVISVFLFGKSLLLTGEYDDLTFYLTDPVNLQMVAEEEVLQGEVSHMQGLINQTDSVKQMLASYPKTNSKVVTAVERARVGDIGVEVTSYDAEKGQLTLKVTTEKVLDLNAYIERLLDTELFAQVDYTGYTYKEDEAHYEVNTTCILLESAGK